MKTFKSEFSAEPNTQLKMMHFEAECEFALLNGYDSIRDKDDRLFQLIDTIDGLNAIEVDETVRAVNGKGSTEQDKEVCSFCQSLANIDDMILECTTSVGRLTMDNLMKLEKLSHIKCILLECL